MKQIVCRTLCFSLSFSALFLVGIPASFAASDAMGGQDVMDDDVAEEDEDAYDRMLELSAEGEQLYESGQFAEAADVYQQAYEAYPQPILLKNQMITRYLIEECEAAIDLGEQFIATGEGSQQDEEDVEAVFGECSLDLAEEAIADEQWTEADEWLEFGEPYLYETQLRQEADQLRAQVDEQTEDDGGFDEVDDAGMSTRELAGWSSLAAGAAVLIGTGIWHVNWELRVAREGTQLEEQYQTVRWAMPTSYAIGGAAAVAGAGLLLWPMLTDGDDSQAMLYPQLSSDGAGAMLTVSF